MNYILTIFKDTKLTQVKVFSSKIEAFNEGNALLKELSFVCIPEIDINASFSYDKTWMFVNAMNDNSNTIVHVTEIEDIQTESIHPYSSIFPETPLFDENLPIGFSGDNKPLKIKDLDAQDPIEFQYLTSWEQHALVLARKNFNVQDTDVDTLADIRFLNKVNPNTLGSIFNYDIAYSTRYDEIISREQSIIETQIRLVKKC